MQAGDGTDIFVRNDVKVWLSSDLGDRRGR